MLSETELQQIIDLVHAEVIPAMGCTEPIAVSLATARAAELLGERPAQIEAQLSANIIKNAMGVGIPGTGGMIGLPIAIALGAIAGRSDYELEVLRDVNPDSLAQAKTYVDQERISIRLKEGISEKLYIEITCRSADGAHSATAIIAGGHTQYVFLAKDGEILLDKRCKGDADCESHSTFLTLAKVWEFATTTPVERIAFILDAARLNMEAAEYSLRGNYGHSLGKIIGAEHGNRIMGDSMFTHIVAYTAGACDARMGGAQIAVMSNSGSGNQGISATVPVVVYARENGIEGERLIRALMLSHLTVIYIKQKLGRLSALCGCVVASTGSSCGLTYLMGGDFNQMCYAVKNMVGNLTGMICDGAKPSCALKVTSGISTAIYSALMAMEGATLTSLEGIVDDDPDRSIDNLTRIGLQGMAQTDREILAIMLGK